MKKTSVGFEAELFLIDSKGKPAPKADNILEKINELDYKNIVCENTKEIIEINALPSNKIHESLIEYINKINILDEIAYKQDLYFLLMGMYPGKYTPEYRTDNPYYNLTKKIFATDLNNFDLARIMSFHFHYFIPSKKQKIVDLFNVLLASIPVFNLIMQSSPFYMGKNISKNSRYFIVSSRKVNLDIFNEEIERDYELITKIKNEPKMFSKQLDYYFSFEDILKDIKNRRLCWNYLKKITDKQNIISETKADYFWGDIRLNLNGTIEFRNPDGNNIDLLLDGLYLYKKICDFICNNQILIKIQGNDILLEENTLFLPSFKNLLKLKFNSAKYGFENQECVEYSKKFIKIFEGFKKIKQIKNMFDGKKSFSDKIIEKAKKIGYNGKMLTDYQAQELSLYFTEKMIKDMEKIKKKTIDYFDEDEIIKTDNEFVSKIFENIGFKNEKIIDLSKGSKNRISNISNIILSPFILKHKKYKKIINDIYNLSKKYGVYMLCFDEDLIFLKNNDYLKEKTNMIKLKDQIKWKDELLGRLNILFTKTNILKKEIAYIGIKEEEMFLMELFGTSVCLPHSDKKIKEKSDILINYLEEIDFFIEKYKKMNKK